LESLDGEDHVIIGGLKFNCRFCQAAVIVKYLTVGEKAECQNCGKTNIVPGGAISTDDSSSILKARLSSPKFPTGHVRLTLAEKIREKYRRIEFWIGAVTVAVLVSLLEYFIKDGVSKLIVSLLIGLLVAATISTLRQEEEESTPKSRLEKTETGYDGKAP
jgi:hypothetical protein